MTSKFLNPSLQYMLERMNMFFEVSDIVLSN